METTFARLLLPADDEVITPALQATGGWDPGETALLGARIRPGMTVVDGGAHVGYFTCLAARLTGPRGLVLAFEPSPRNHELLLANVWRNGFTNVVCLPWALGRENGFGSLALSSANTGDNRLAAPGGVAGPGVPVRIAALDTVGLLQPPLDVVKLDLQGVEEDAVQGMRTLLDASPGVLVIAEFWPAQIVRNGGSPAGALATYRSLGLTIGVQQADERNVRHGLDDEEIVAECRTRDAGEGHVNLVLERPGAER